MSISVCSLNMAQNRVLGRDFYSELSILPMAQLALVVNLMSTVRGTKPRNTESSTVAPMRTELNFVDKCDAQVFLLAQV